MKNTIDQPITAGLRTVWRNYGPSGWIKIVGTQFPIDTWYDGGLPGVSVQFSDWGKRGLYWKKQTCFIPFRTVAGFTRYVRNRGLFLPKEIGRQKHNIWNIKWPQHG